MYCKQRIMPWRRRHGNNTAGAKGYSKGVPSAHHLCERWNESLIPFTGSPVHRLCDDAVRPCPGAGPAFLSVHFPRHVLGRLCLPLASQSPTLTLRSTEALRVAEARASSRSVGKRSFSPSANVRRARTSKMRLSGKSRSPAVRHRHEYE
jgi:hypothetical protein